MNNKTDIKKYISQNILYNEKMRINKNSSCQDIFNSYSNIYKKDWIKLPLKIDNNFNLHINYKILEPIINIFLDISNLVDKKNSEQEKFLSSLTHEIYNNLYIEHYVSSRKIINDIVNRKETINKDKVVENTFNAMNYVNQSRKINKENLIYLYKTLTNDIDMGKEQLDGIFYRLDNVSISGNDKGIDPSLIDEYMNDLFQYINSYNDDLSLSQKIIKAIIIHFYFEYVHPYYDFNGRTGRLLVLWYAKNNNINDNLSFFSTSIAAYRDQYLKLFKQTRFNQTIDITYFVANIIYILFKEKEHYLTILKFDEYVIKNFNKRLSSIQKNILMFDQSIRDIYNLNYYSAISISKIIKQYNEYSIQLIYRELKSLETYGILKKINKRDASYYIEYNLITRVR